MSLGFSFSILEPMSSGKLYLSALKQLLPSCTYTSAKQSREESRWIDRDWCEGLHEYDIFTREIVEGGVYGSTCILLTYLHPHFVETEEVNKTCRIIGTLVEQWERYSTVRLLSTKNLVPISHGPYTPTIVHIFAREISTKCQWFECFCRNLWGNTHAQQHTKTAAN